MSEKTDSTKLTGQELKAARLNKALRQNLRKRKAEAVDSDAVMSRRTSAINKRTGPKLKRPE